MHKLVYAQHTRIVLSIKSVLCLYVVLKKSIGKTFFNIVYFCLTFPITRSICIRTLAIILVSSTSIADSCVFPLVKACFLRLACIVPTESEMSNPRSAKNISPGSKLYSKPQCSVRYLSLTRLPHALETKLITPCGVYPISTVTVLWCLKFDHVAVRAWKLEGLSKKF